MSDQDKVSTWDQNTLANALLGPKGGLAVWVRRPEQCARAAIRGSGDLLATVIEIAHLGVGLQRMTDSMAQHFNVPPAKFGEMVALARGEIEPHVDHATRIKRSGEDGREPPRCWTCCGAST